jgi:hypothetical protein
MPLPLSNRAFANESISSASKMYNMTRRTAQLNTCRRKTHHRPLTHCQRRDNSDNAHPHERNANISNTNSTTSQERQKKNNVLHPSLNMQHLHPDHKTALRTLQPCRDTQLRAIRLSEPHEKTAMQRRKDVQGMCGAEGQLEHFTR